MTDRDKELDDLEKVLIDEQPFIARPDSMDLRDGLLCWLDGQGLRCGLRGLQHRPARCQWRARTGTEQVHRPDLHGPTGILGDVHDAGESQADQSRTRCGKTQTSDAKGLIMDVNKTLACVLDSLAELARRGHIDTDHPVEVSTSPDGTVHTSFMTKADFDVIREETLRLLTRTSDGPPSLGVYAHTDPALQEHVTITIKDPIW